MSKQQNSSWVDVHRVMAVLSDILSDLYGLEIKMTAKPKEPEPAESLAGIPA